jgi:hypothetical protein
MMMESTMRDGAGFWDVEFYDFVSGCPGAVEGLPGFGDLHERAAGNGARHGTPVIVFLRKALAELSLELQEAREELTTLGNVTRLHSRRGPARHGDEQ